MSWKRTATGRRTVLWLLAWLVIAAIVAALPFLYAMGAFALADALGCKLSTARLEPCMIDKADISPMLALGLHSWLFVPFTVGLGALMVLAAIMGFIGSFFRPKVEAE